ncbi:MAG: cell division protein FtsL [Eggerthellaceae bacterium]|nr:cell division protein FtsL [Eggerthellaceae bacterium]
MSAAPAYSHYAQAAPQRYDFPGYREYDRFDSSPDISVVPGSGSRTKSSADSAVVLAKVTAIIMIVIALVCCARVFLSSMAVSTALEAREISSQINDARSDGSKLEVALSSLSNPSFVKQEAAALGMFAPDSDAVLKIDLSGDVVVTDAAGTLLLSGSADVIAQG